VVEGHVYFYFLTDGHYGKGEVHWGVGGEGLDTRLGYTVVVQPDKTPVVASREPQ
jgi:hypothetical protein